MCLKCPKGQWGGSLLAPQCMQLVRFLAWWCCCCSWLTFVFKTSGCLRRPSLRGCHPRLLKWSVGFGHPCKRFSMQCSRLGQCLDCLAIQRHAHIFGNWERFLCPGLLPFSNLSLLMESPTCQWAVPFGTWMQTPSTLCSHLRYNSHKKGNWKFTYVRLAQERERPTCTREWKRLWNPFVPASTSGVWVWYLRLQQTNGGQIVPRKLQVGAHIKPQGHSCRVHCRPLLPLVRMDVDAKFGVPGHLSAAKNAHITGSPVAVNQAQWSAPRMLPQDLCRLSSVFSKPFSPRLSVHVCIVSDQQTERIICCMIY
jgi:hypothetical protein